MKVNIRDHEREEVALAKLNDLFRDAMLKRTLKKLDEGFSGWSDRKEMLQHDGHVLRYRIIRNALNGDWVDVANLAMFAWNFEKGK